MCSSDLTGQPVDYAGAVGETATFTVAATGEGLTYQWQFRKPGESFWQTSVSAASHTATMTVEITAARIGQAYRCIVTDASGTTITSNEAEIVLQE